MKLSILIVNWNSREYLSKCLDSIRDASGELDIQIVVVDGGSFDGCAEMLASNYPEVRFVQSAENIGFGRSNNLGFDYIEGDLLLLLNPDTELRTRALESMIAALTNLPDAGLVGALLLNTDGSKQLASVHRLPTPWIAATDCNWLRRRWWRKNVDANGGNPTEVEAVSGACMLMRSETFRQVGGFDPRFFMYAEDMDLCWKTRGLGLRIYHVPTATVMHHGGVCSGTRFSKFSSVMIREALNAYMLKNYGWAHACLFRLFTGLAAMLRIPLLAGIFVCRLRFSKIGNSLTPLKKWWALLRWSLGLEKWAKKHFEVTHALQSAPNIGVVIHPN